MYEATFELETLTPLFMRGADQRKAEFRSASVKGVMRWWFRAFSHAVLFGNVPESEAISITKASEAKLFGSTGQKSRVWVRVSFKPNGEREINARELSARYLTFGLSGKGLTGTAKITLSSSERRYLNLAKSVAKAAFVFGGLGARTTRGMGSVQPIGEEISTKYIQEIYSTAIETMEEYLDYKLDRNADDVIPQFPAAHPKFFRMKLSSKSYNRPYGKSSALSDLDGTFHRFRHSGPEHKRLIKNKVIQYKVTNQYSEVMNAYNGNSSVSLPYSAFGLPHQYNFFSLSIKGLIIEGEVHNRRASPIRFKVVRGSKGKYRQLILYLKYTFLPQGEKLQVRLKNNIRAKGIPQPEYGEVENFFNQFPGQEVLLI